MNAVLGIYVGSFVWNETTMQVLLAREKKFITGSATAETMQQLLKMPIDPKVLLALFWDDPLPKNEWSARPTPRVAKKFANIKICRLISLGKSAKIYIV